MDHIPQRTANAVPMETLALFRMLRAAGFKHTFGQTERAREHFFYDPVAVEYALWKNDLVGTSFEFDEIEIYVWAATH